MVDTKVVQATSNHHDRIGKIIFGISQHIFHSPRAFDACNGMFHADTNFGYLAVALFVPGSQFFLAWLFFGCNNFRTLGS